MSEQCWAHDPPVFDPMQPELSPADLLPEFAEEYRVALRMCDKCNRVLEIKDLRLVHTEPFKGTACAERFEKGVDQCNGK